MKNLYSYLYLVIFVPLIYNGIYILIFLILAKLEGFYHPNHQIMIKIQNETKKFLLRSIISILIFVTGTTFSYRNDMAKDGYETMGFPLSFYLNNPDPADISAKTDNLYPWYLVFDFLLLLD